MAQAEPSADAAGGRARGSRSLCFLLALKCVLGSALIAETTTIGRKRVAMRAIIGMFLHHLVFSTLIFGENATRIGDSVCLWSAYDCTPTSNPVAGPYELEADMSCLLGVRVFAFYCAVVDARESLPDNAAARRRDAARGGGV